MCPAAAAAAGYALTADDTDDNCKDNARHATCGYCLDTGNGSPEAYESDCAGNCKGGPAYIGAKRTRIPAP